MGNGGSAGNGGSLDGSSASAGSGGSSMGNGGSAGNGGSLDGSSDSAGGSGDSGGKSCDDLLGDVRAKLAQAKACCPLCGIANQCSGSVPGVCCPETVNFAASGTTANYLAALDTFQNAGCSIPCPRIACRVTPSNMCQTDGSCL
jgi:hypothetical protein